MRSRPRSLSYCRLPIPFGSRWGGCAGRRLTIFAVLTCVFSPGGARWSNVRSRRGRSRNPPHRCPRLLRWRPFMTRPERCSPNWPACPAGLHDVYARAGLPRPLAAESNSDLAPGTEDYSAVQAVVEHIEMLDALLGVVSTSDKDTSPQQGVMYLKMARQFLLQLRIG